jgi:hypothetical protein
MALRLGDTAPNFKVGSVNSYRSLNADLEADNDSQAQTTIGEIDVSS